MFVERISGSTQKCLARDKLPRKMRKLAGVSELPPNQNAHNPAATIKQWIARSRFEDTSGAAINGSGESRLVRPFSSPEGFRRAGHGVQKLDRRKSLAFASTFSRIAGSGNMRAISMAPIMVENI